MTEEHFASLPEVTLADGTSNWAIYKIPAEGTILGPVKPDYTMRFHNGANYENTIGTLDFSGPVMTFTGDAEESAKLFFGRLAKLFASRLEQVEKPRTLYAALDKLDAEDTAKYEQLQADAERLAWLEQQHWDMAELYSLVNSWITRDGKRHPQGLASAIDAAMAQQKETK